MKKFLRVLAPFFIIAIILCIPSVTQKLPEPFKTAFNELRENAVKLTTREGYGKLEFSNPRGIFAPESGNGIEHVGGR